MVGLDLPLDVGWTSLDLGDPKRMAKDIGALVKTQLRGIPNAPVLRGQLTSWLSQTGKRAAGGGGRFMAYLTRRTETAAAALSVVEFWHDRGIVGDHLDELAAQLTAAADAAGTPPANLGSCACTSRTTRSSPTSSRSCATSTRRRRCSASSPRSS